MLQEGENEFHRSGFDSIKVITILDGRRKQRLETTSYAIPDRIEIALKYHHYGHV